MIIYNSKNLFCRQSNYWNLKNKKSYYNNNNNNKNNKNRNKFNKMVIN